MKLFRRLIFLVLILLFIGYATVLHTTITTLEDELSTAATKYDTDLAAVEDELETALDWLAEERSTVAMLQSELNTANEIVSAINSEEWALNTTITELEIDMLAKTVWGEARGCDKLGQSAVVWCVLNRVDAGQGTIAQVITAPQQFHGYSSNFPVDPEIKALVLDVVARWKLEKVTTGDVGRTLPAEFLFFCSDSTGIGNIFRTEWNYPCTVWDWDCWNPYEE